MTMSSYDKGSRELAAAWLRRGSAIGTRKQPAQPRRRGEGGGAQPATKPEGGAVFHSDMHVSFSRA